MTACFPVAALIAAWAWANRRTVTRLRARARSRLRGTPHPAALEAAVRRHPSGTGRVIRPDCRECQGVTLTAHELEVLAGYEAAERAEWDALAAEAEGFSAGREGDRRGR